MIKLDHATVGQLKQALKLAPDSMPMKMFVGERRVVSLDYKAKFSGVKIYLTLEEGHAVTDKLNDELVKAEPNIAKELKQ
jgi:hypothetical protein